MLKFLFALILPGLLVVLFARVTYSHIVGLLLTIALIAGSVYKGYTDSYVLIIADALSLTVGFGISVKMIRKIRR